MCEGHSVIDLRKIILVGLALIISLAMIIAGAIMITLGIFSIIAFPLVPPVITIVVGAIVLIVGSIILINLRLRS